VLNSKKELRAVSWGGGVGKGCKKNTGWWGGVGWSKKRNKWEHDQWLGVWGTVRVRSGDHLERWKRGWWGGGGGGAWGGGKTKKKIQGEKNVECVGGGGSKKIGGGKNGAQLDKKTILAKRQEILLGGNKTQ